MAGCNLHFLTRPLRSSRTTDGARLSRLAAVPYLPKKRPATLRTCDLAAFLRKPEYAKEDICQPRL